MGRGKILNIVYSIIYYVSYWRYYSHYIREITAITLPSEVPIVIDKSNIIETGIGIIIMSLLGALIPIRQIAKVDPYKIIGG